MTATITLLTMMFWLYGVLNDFIDRRLFWFAGGLFIFPVGVLRGLWFALGGREL